MKRNTLFSGLFLALLLAAAPACKKDKASTTGPEDSVPAAPVNAHLAGVVHAIGGQPLADVSVQVNSESATTDANGHFALRDVILDEGGSPIRFEKPGFFPLIKIGRNRSGQWSFQSPMLTPRSPTLTFPSASGQQLMVSNAELKIPAGSFREASGTAYTGEVTLYAYSLRLSPSPPISAVVPGDFRAVSREGERGQVALMATLFLAFEGEAEQPLTLSRPIEAKLTNVFLPASPAFPANVFFPQAWHFDESDAAWKASAASAIFGDGGYTIQMDRPGHWCLGLFHASSRTAARLEGRNGSPWAQVPVNIRKEGLPVGLAYTGLDGRFECSTPAEGEYTFELPLANDCDLSFSGTLTAFPEPVDLGKVTPGFPNAEVAVAGRLVDCEGKPLSDGYVAVAQGLPRYLATVSADGHYAWASALCEPAELSVRYYRPGGLPAGDLIQLSLAPGETADLGTVPVCD